MKHALQPLEPSVLSHLAPRAAERGAFERLVAERAATLDPRVSLDKALPALCHLLRGLRPELGEAVDALDPLARSLDVRALGPSARGLPAAMVRRLGRLLDNVSTESFEEAYDGGSLAEAQVPPDCWDDDDAREWLLDHLATLRQVIEAAVLTGQALVVVSEPPRREA